MKDNKQNLTDLIGALAVDIEDVKKKLDAKDSSDKNEALKRLEAKLEPVIRFFNGNAPENVNAIFGSKEAIEEYKQSIGDEAVASLRLYTEANEKDMRKYGIPTIKEQLNKILERLTSHIENDKLASEKSRQKQSAISELWQIIRPDKAISAIRQLWGKVPDGWHKNPYAWAGIGCTLVFFALFIVSWVQWHDYREENRRLRTVADKHHVHIRAYPCKAPFPHLEALLRAQVFPEDLAPYSTQRLFILLECGRKQQCLPGLYRQHKGKNYFRRAIPANNLPRLHLLKPRNGLPEPAVAHLGVVANPVHGILRLLYDARRCP